MIRFMSARVAAVLCVLSCATVAGFEVWPAARGIRTADKNGDGRPDVWRFYDARGRLTRVNVDSNFDGTPDIEEYYEHGALVRRESDRNFNGQADLVEEFDAETHGQTRSAVDLDYDGTADLLVLFQDGRPVYSTRNPSPKRSGIPSLRPPTAQGSDASDLTRLIDPFEADTALRAVHVTSIDEGCVGLSTAGGLPCSRVTALRGESSSARLVVRHVQPRALPLRLSRSPRAPPTS